MDKLKLFAKKVGRLLVFACVAFLLGCLVGIHRNVIKACLKGEPMPEAPSWHFWCK